LPPHLRDGALQRNVHIMRGARHYAPRFAVRRGPDRPRRRTSGAVHCAWAINRRITLLFDRAVALAKRSNFSRSCAPSRTLSVWGRAFFGWLIADAPPQKETRLGQSLLPRRVRCPTMCYRYVSIFVASPPISCHVLPIHC